MGAALGGTWIHIEGGQPYLTPPPDPKVDAMARRHRDLVYELIRKGILTPTPTLANLNRTCLEVEIHPEYARLRQEGGSLKSFKTSAASAPLRQGFLASRIMLEPWPAWAFARLAYDQRWHVETCFPKTPLGWVPIVTRECGAPKGFTPLRTDAENVWMNDAWAAPSEKASAIGELLKAGANGIPLRAPEACAIVQQRDGEGNYRVILIDPGYLAPRGVEAHLESAGGALQSVVDAVSGESLKPEGACCAISIPRGAFRIVDANMQAKR
ncbi:MAG: hypothetical protein NTW86_03045 [Candidatus Sumerlaeota bacterium]|nr:hypothetical protein [Candidatus Sumerlaeota bacterium]